MTAITTTDHPLYAGEDAYPLGADPKALARRVDDLPLPDQKLDWGDEGTPLEAPSIVYMRRPRDQTFPLWEQIKTQERLAATQAAPEHYELQVLFAVPIEDLARGQLVPIMDARMRLDRMKAATSKVVTGIYEAIDVMNEIRNKP